MQQHNTRSQRPSTHGILTHVHLLTPACTSTPTHTPTFTYTLTRALSLPGTHERKGTLQYTPIHQLSKDLCVICDEFGDFLNFLMNIFCKTN